METLALSVEVGKTDTGVLGGIGIGLALRQTLFEKLVRAMNNAATHSTSTFIGLWGADVGGASTAGSDIYPPTLASSPQSFNTDWLLSTLINLVDELRAPNIQSSLYTMTSAGLISSGVANAVRTENYPWACSLNREERAEMEQELAGALVTALLTKNWLLYYETLEAWEATAEVLSDPELTARLIEVGDPSEEVPLRRP